MVKPKILYSAISVMLVLFLSAFIVYAGDGNETDTEITTDIEITTETDTESTTDNVTDTESTTEPTTEPDTETDTETTTEDFTGNSGEETTVLPPGSSDPDPTTEDTTQRPDTPTEPTTQGHSAPTETTTQSRDTTTETTTQKQDKDPTTETTTTERPTSGSHSGSGGGGGSGGSGGGVFNSGFSRLANKNKTEPVKETTTEQTTAEKKLAPKSKSSVRFAKKILTFMIDSSIAYLDKVPIFVIYSPYIQKSSNSTLISVRSLQKGLGDDVNITWNARTKTAVVVYNGHKVEITANRRYMLADGKRVYFKYGAFAEIKNDRIYLPFRALGEALGFKVTWDGKTRTAAYLL